MIKSEYLNDGTLIRQWSDAGVMLLQVETGAMYSDPVDLVPCRYTYQETDVLVGFEDEADGEEEITDEEFVDMLEEVL